ncbi:hypothetical protein ZEAMMB73_Zm00001d011808 [Zea mays]|jgi:hypothetical protein|uniref:Uncharacterized protein n=1 Tax=Zea mays TaxID=4577 RepID=A0A1D6G3Z9_MAIZE|nr:hypothetical protein ZEAMMB73_Zm00001d011808 [Zea mays]
MLDSLATVTASSSSYEGGGEEARRGGVASCARRRGETRPAGLAGTGGLHCTDGVGLAARRGSDNARRFAAGEGERRTERSRGTCLGGGDADARALRERTP